MLRALPNERPVSRFGFAVGKKVGGAVVRNLLKRRLREAVRQLPIRPGVDVVIIGRPVARGSSYKDIEAALVDVLRRARLLEPAEAAGALPRS